MAQNTGTHSPYTRSELHIATLHNPIQELLDRNKKKKDVYTKLKPHLGATVIEVYCTFFCDSIYINIQNENVSMTLVSTPGNLSHAHIIKQLSLITTLIRHLLLAAFMD